MSGLVRFGNVRYGRYGRYGRAIELMVCCATEWRGLVLRGLVMLGEVRILAIALGLVR